METEAFRASKLVSLALIRTISEFAQICSKFKIEMLVSQSIGGSHNSTPKYEI